jgi:hypothetical protein
VNCGNCIQDFGSTIRGRRDVNGGQEPDICIRDGTVLCFPANAERNGFDAAMSIQEIHQRRVANRFGTKGAKAGKENSSEEPNWRRASVGNVELKRDDITKKSETLPKL